MIGARVARHPSGLWQPPRLFLFASLKGKQHRQQPKESTMPSSKGKPTDPKLREEAKKGK